MKRAKGLASLGLILVFVLIALYQFAIPSNLDALYQWNAAGKRVAWTYQDETATSKVNGLTFPDVKGALTFNYVDCKHDYNREQDFNLCEYQQKQDRVSISDLLKTKPMEKRIESMNSELVKVRKAIEADNNQDADINYMVWEIKQIAYNAGVKQSEIKMPLTIKEKIILWMNQESLYIIYCIACLVAFLSFIPIAWLGLWRGVGIAVRSAKKEINGDK